MADVLEIIAKWGQQEQVVFLTLATCFVLTAVVAVSCIACVAIVRLVRGYPPPEVEIPPSRSETTTNNYDEAKEPQ